MSVEYLKSGLSEASRSEEDLKVRKVVEETLASIEKAKKLLNYQPTHNLKQGLNSAIEWYWNYFKSN